MFTDINSIISLINLDQVPDWSVILVYDHGVAFNEQLQLAEREVRTRKDGASFEATTPRALEALECLDMTGCFEFRTDESTGMKPHEG